MKQIEGLRSLFCRKDEKKMEGQPQYASFAEYYKRKYDIELMHVDAPLIQVRPASLNMKTSIVDIHSMSMLETRRNKNPKIQEQCTYFFAFRHTGSRQGGGRGSTTCSPPSTTSSHLHRNTPSTPNSLMLLVVHL